MPTRAVLFDYGHTLVDFTLVDDALLAAYQQVAEMLSAQAFRNVPEASVFVERVTRAIEEEVTASYTRGELDELDVVALFQQALGGLGLEVTTSQARQIAELEHRAMVSRLTIRADHLAVLRDLRAMGLRIGLVSNAHFLPDLMREDIERLGVLPLLDASVFSAEIRTRKPHPAIFRAVLDALGVQPVDAVFVGDRLRDDIGGATALGMRGVLTHQFRQEEVDERVARPDLVIDRLTDLPLWIQTQLAG